MSDLCELRGILIPRTSVNKGRSCSPVQPQIPLRVQIIVDSSVVGYDGAVRDEEHSVWQTKPEREQKEETKQSRWGFRGMTVREWLELLIVPVVLALITVVFSWQQNERQQDLEDQRVKQAQKIESQRAKAERELAEQRAQDEALQAYLSQMSSLLLEKDLRESTKEDSEVRTLARARTLTVLSSFDPSGKTAVMQFLEEATLVQRVAGRDPIISLRSADLSGADLNGFYLSGAYLSRANLFDAYLSDANLSGAEGITNEELEQQAVSLKGATMPNGQKYEDWLKDREKRQQDE
jgi:multidrug efflux pump subunit AcrA (membrane-fusion protein)